MSLFEINGDNLDIYQIIENKEKLRKYKQKILEENKEKQIFYVLMTNRFENILNLNIREVGLDNINYSNSTLTETNDWSTLNPIGKHSVGARTRKEILKKYIDGEYDKLLPTEVVGNNQKYHFLKPDKEKILLRASEDKIYRVNNLIDLPEKLYLLQLLLNEKYVEIANKNIEEQLSLFDIEYLKSIKKKVLEELGSLGIIDLNNTSLNEKAQINKKIIDMARVKK